MREHGNQDQQGETAYGLAGWGRGSSGAGWRRHRDPIGRHTMIAAVLGVVAAALIGALFDPLNLRTSDDLRRAEDAAYDQAYAEVADAGYVDGVPYGRVEHLGASIVTRGVGLDVDYGMSFAEGWAVGWNDALEAMRAEAQAAGLAEGYTEFTVLSELEGRRAAR